jgi:hypothetical protein
MNLAKKNILINFVSEESRIGFTHYKVVLEKKILKTFIPCSTSLLKPIEHLMELVHMVWKFWGSSKPGGCSPYTNSDRGLF